MLYKRFYIQGDSNLFYFSHKTLMQIVPTLATHNNQLLPNYWLLKLYFFVTATKDVIC